MLWKMRAHKERRSVKSYISLLGCYTSLPKDWRCGSADTLAAVPSDGVTHSAMLDNPVSHRIRQSSPEKQNPSSFQSTNLDTNFSDKSPSVVLHCIPTKPACIRPSKTWPQPAAAAGPPGLSSALQGLQSYPSTIALEL